MGKIENEIRKWQSESGVTSTEMAKRLGVSLQCVGALIHERANFGRATAYRWKEEFGFDPAFLMSGDGSLIPKENSSLAAAAEPQREVLTLDKSTVTEMLLTLTRAVDKQADIIQELRHQEIKKAGLPDSSQKVG